MGVSRLTAWSLAQIAARMACVELSMPTTIGAVVGWFIVSFPVWWIHRQRFGRRGFVVRIGRVANHDRDGTVVEQVQTGGTQHSAGDQAAATASDDDELRILRVA